jgi:outer membrane protein OmpA-like peptidoglycan-associated protein
MRAVFLICFSILMAGCASSAVQRDAASNIDLGVRNAKNLVSGDTDISDAYQNSSQATKGALIGGTAGAVTGAIYSSSIGVLPGLAVGAILGGSYGAYIDANTTLKDKLENRGANIIVLGDQVMVVIPSARIFNPYTSTIKPQAYSTLNLLTKYLNSFTKMLVKVSVYTDDTGSNSVDRALSSQQAHQVEKYLVAAGADARVLYATGYGGSHLVTTNCGEWDNDNYRIEITLEKLIV